MGQVTKFPVKQLGMGLKSPSLKSERSVGKRVALGCCRIRFSNPLYARIKFRRGEHLESPESLHSNGSEQSEKTLNSIAPLYPERGRRQNFCPDTQRSGASRGYVVRLAEVLTRGQTVTKPAWEKSLTRTPHTVSDWQRKNRSAAHFMGEVEGSGDWITVMSQQDAASLSSRDSA